MRTLRKVFCVLALALLITSSAAFAAPEEGPNSRAPSFSSWVLTLLDSIVGYVLPAKVKIGPPGEFGGGVDPQGSVEKDGEQDPPDGEIGGVIEPNG